MHAARGVGEERSFDPELPGKSFLRMREANSLDARAPSCDHERDIRPRVSAVFTGENQFSSSYASYNMKLSLSAVAVRLLIFGASGLGFSC